MPWIAWKIILYAVAGLTLMGAGAKIMSIWDAGTIAKYQTTITAQRAVVRQVTAVTAQITKSDQAAEVAAQAKIVTQTRTVTKEITRYVPRPGPSVSVPCVSNGMLRVHDAAVLGVDPSTILPPASSPDDACSPVAASDFMADINANYGVARANAEQLNALEADVTARANAVAAAQGPAPPLVTPTD
jgi:hypothetical protein